MAVGAVPQRSPSSSLRRSVGDSVDGTESLEVIPPSSPAIGRRSRQARYGTDPDRARQLIAKTGQVAVDLETRGLHPHSSEDAAIGAVILRTGDQTFIL